jgi:hypothetical protein
MYTGISPKAAVFSVLFYNEARKRWQENAQYNSSIPAVAAINLLSMAVITYGKDDLANRYMSDGIKMARHLGILYDPTDISFEDNPLHERSDKWRKAASYTAWGVFNWAWQVTTLTRKSIYADAWSISVYCLHYQLVLTDIEKPPILPTPGSVDDGKPTLLDVEVLEARCQMSVIMIDVMWWYYDGLVTPSPLRRGASLEFAEEVYRRLLDWAASVPTRLSRSDESSHAIILMQWVIGFHITQEQKSQRLSTVG